MAKTYTVAFGSGDPRSYTGLSPTLLIFVNASSGATLVAPTFSEALTGSGIYKFAYGTTTPIAFLADAATTSPGALGRYVTGQIDPADRSDEYGTTIVAIGTSNIALGTTNVALGTSISAQGVSISAQGVSILAFGVSTLAFGSTLTGFGTSLTASQVSIAGQGTSITAQGVSITAQGVSLTAQGVSLFAFGTSTISFGVSLVALGNTILASTGTGSTLVVTIGTTASLIGNSTTDPSDLFGYVKRIAELIQGQQLFTKGSGVLDLYDRTGATLLTVRTVSNNASLVTKS